MITNDVETTSILYHRLDDGVARYVLDQGIRRLSGRMYSFLYNDSIKPIIELVDSLILRRILQIYQEYSLVIEVTVGHSYESQMWLILLHNNKQAQMMRELFDLLKQ